ncbi:TRAP transporter small permease [Rhodobacteraceae bacterium LMO-12]|nr:TRAP transporter small permease [Rhodobacteraceae bacterium LMO-JJ12]
MKNAERFLRALFALEAAGAILAYVLIASMLLGDVIAREVLGTSLGGVQRISVYLMIITGFLGLGLASAKGRHLRPRFADGLIPETFTTVASRIGSGLMCIIFIGFFVIAVQYVHETYSYGDLARSTKFPLWVIQLIIPYAFASISLRYLIFFVYPALSPSEELSE